MITSVRTAAINDGKGEAGFAWAVELAHYITENLDINVRVLRNIGGPVYQLHWVFATETLAEYQAALQKITDDEGFQKRSAEAREQQLLSASSLVDSLYETIS